MLFTRRRTLVAALLVAVAGVALFRLLDHGDGVIRPDNPCTERPPLRHYRGVTLQPVAMKAFKEAVRATHHAIQVVQSYRSCHQQAVACKGICGDPNGCAGRCARPGTSYHQIGAAIDITQGSLDTPGVIAELERDGWCQSQPKSDPGHFSYGGCH
jgi:hypothetical protein